MNGGEGSRGRQVVQHFTVPAAAVNSHSGRKHFFRTVPSVIRSYGREYFYQELPSAGNGIHTVTHSYGYGTIPLINIIYISDLKHGNTDKIFP